MSASKADSTAALVAVVKALEPLTEHERSWVLQSAATRWGNAAPISPISGQGTGAQLPPTGSLLSASGDTQSALASQNVRSFVRLKQPANDVQRVACLVYFLTHTQNKLGFTSKEITQAHTDSGGSAINMTRALDNATRQTRYLSSRGRKEKQLTPLGEDAVNALPSQEAVRGLGAGSKGPKKKKRKR